MKILVTGCAGFIGYHVCEQLLINKKNKVIGIDNVNNYYDIKLKKNRLQNLKKKFSNFNFFKKDISDKKNLHNIFRKNKFDYVVHLAAQAGVRYAEKNPDIYFNSNILGFFNVLDLCRLNKIKHLLFASTSSVYGDTLKFPTSEKENSSNPLTFYAASKKSNEVMAYSYSNIYKLPCTGIRFFTVYGPYGRPDMAIFKFTKSIIESKFIKLFNRGKHYRDFTYITDAVTPVIKLLNKPPKNKIPFQIFNCGNSKSISIGLVLKSIEKTLNKKSLISLRPFQKGDVLKTHSNSKNLHNKTKFKPQVGVIKGIEKFIIWYKEYYK